MSTEPIAAAESLGAGTVIVKALHEHFVEASPGLLTGVFPEITDVGAMQRAGRRAGFPSWCKSTSVMRPRSGAISSAAMFDLLDQQGESGAAVA